MRFERSLSEGTKLRVLRLLAVQTVSAGKWATVLSAPAQRATWVFRRNVGRSASPTRNALRLRPVPTSGAGILVPALAVKMRSAAWSTTIQCADVQPDQREIH